MSKEQTALERKNPHIILLDGKLWAFEPPEKPVFDYDHYGTNTHQFLADDEAYNRAYSLALEQKIEIDKDGPFVFTSKYGISAGRSLLESQLLKENEPIKWEGSVEIIKQFRPVGTAAWHDLTGVTVHDNSGFEFRKLVRLIAPVKEGLIEKLNKVSDKLDAEDKGRRNLTSDQLAVNADAQHPKPVPSEQENLANYVDLKEEQENQEDLWNEIFTKSSWDVKGLMQKFNLTDISRMANGLQWKAIN